MTGLPQLFFYLQTYLQSPSLLSQEKGVVFSKAKLPPWTILHPSLFCWGLGHSSNPTASCIFDLLISTGFFLSAYQLLNFCPSLKRISTSEWPAFQYTTSPFFHETSWTLVSSSFFCLLSLTDLISTLLFCWNYSW